MEEKSYRQKDIEQVSDWDNWEREHEQKKQEKRKNVNNLFPPVTEKLDNVFNPAEFGVTYPENFEEGSVLEEDKRMLENDLYCEIIKGLEHDLEKLGMDLTYSTKIIIREVAMNLVLLQRIKTQFICRGLLRHKQELKKSYVSENNNRYSETSKKSFFYDNFLTNEEEVHPLFDRLIPKIQKQINYGLKQLGLLPTQQIEKQKLVIIKKLRQKLLSIEKGNKKYSIDSIEERKINL